MNTPHRNSYSRLTGVEAGKIPEVELKKQQNCLYYVCSLCGAHVAQSVERVLGKDEVTGSSPVVGSILNLAGFQLTAISAGN